MDEIFAVVNKVFAFVVPAADFLWDFPTNFSWWSRIPVLGNLTFAILLLVGSGIYFTVRTGFIQVTHFKDGIRAIMREKSASTGISPRAAFFLSSAMRVGPGNIVGVTGAIAVGGPGALFWMWVSAFFGMATAYAEAVLAQIFKEKKGREYVGGLPFYGKKLLHNRAFVGVALSFLFITYAFFCLPAQAFNVFSSVGQMAGIVTGNTYETTSVLYYVIGIVLIAGTAVVAFGGIRKVTRVTDFCVPVMAVLYCGIVILMILFNLDRLPAFFISVFGGAFRPEALFGGAMGTALAQGVKRGLMSNEAGQGTITMSAAAAEAEHPCEQGCVQAVGVFLDTLVICTLTGFVVIMAQTWDGMDSAAWAAASGDSFSLFLASLSSLIPGSALDGAVTFLICLCYGLFAYTTLLGMLSFAEIAANRISRKKSFINGVRAVGAFVFIPFGVLCVLAGLELSNLWYISDLGNILIVFANLPLLYLGARYVFQATGHYKAKDGTAFTGAVIGRKCSCWPNQGETETDADAETGTDADACASAAAGQN